MDDFLPALLEHFGQRRLDDLLLFLSHAEDRGLLHLHAHHKTDDHQHCGQQERHTPTPCQHRIVIVERFQQEVGAVRQEETDRSTQLREGAIQRTLVVRSVLGGHQSGTRPFAAQTDALHETAQAQRDSHNAPLAIGRQAADQERGDTHGQQRNHQCGLAAHAVAEMAEHQGSERTCNERDGEGQQAG